MARSRCKLTLAMLSMVVALLVNAMPGLAMVSYDKVVSSLSGYRSLTQSDNGYFAVTYATSTPYHESLYLYKGSGAPVKIAEGAIADNDIAINNKGWLVWKESDSSLSTGRYSLYCYRGSGKPVKLAASDSNLFNVKINNNGWVAWDVSDGKDKEIFLYKGSGTPVQLTNNDGYQDTLLAINDNNWVLYRNNEYNYDLYLYKGAGQPVKIKDNIGLPSLSQPMLGPNGWVVWREKQKYHYDYYLHKGSGTPIRLTNNVYGEANLTISSNN